MSRTRKGKRRYKKLLQLSQYAKGARRYMPIFRFNKHDGRMVTVGATAGEVLDMATGEWQKTGESVDYQDLDRWDKSQRVWSTDVYVNGALNYTIKGRVGKGSEREKPHSPLCECVPCDVEKAKAAAAAAKAKVETGTGTGATPEGRKEVLASWREREKEREHTPYKHAYNPGGYGGGGHYPGSGTSNYVSGYDPERTAYYARPTPKIFDGVDRKKWPTAFWFLVRFYASSDFHMHSRTAYPTYEEWKKTEAEKKAAETAAEAEVTSGDVANNTKTETGTGTETETTDEGEIYGNYGG